MLKNVRRFSLVEGHVKIVNDEFYSHELRHCPPDDTAAEYVEDDRKKQEAARYRYLRCVRNPELIGGRGDAFAVRQVGRRSCFLVADRRLISLTTAGALNVVLA